MPDPRALMQAFQQLMQDPNAMQAMMQGAQQMGIPPEMLQQLSGAGGGMMQGPGGGGAPMPPDMGGAGPSEGAPPPQEGEPSPEEMAQGEIDDAGNTWDGVDAPTQNDIERLKESPTDTAVESFDAQFGDGAAAQYLGDQSGEPADEPEGEGPPEEKEAGE